MNYQLLKEILAARPKAFAFLAFLGVLTVALSVYLSLWQRPALEKAQSDWFAKREAIASGAVAGSVTAYQNAERELATFRKTLIPKRDFPRFLGELYRTVGANSLKLKAVTYKPTLTKEPGVISYGLSFTVSGRYAGVKSFIADVSRFPELVTLDSVGLSSTSPTQEAVDLKVQMTAFLKTEGA